MMSIYLSGSFPRSNSSLVLCSGNACKSEVLRLREDIFLVDAGLGTPRMSMQDEPTGVPINRATRFEKKVGSLDLVAGESRIKERAAARLNDLVGSTDRIAGEPLLPRGFRQNRAWIELNKIWRTNPKVKGFLFSKGKGGSSVAIAGFLAFLPFQRSRQKSQRNDHDRFIIKSINFKRKNIRLWCYKSKKRKPFFFFI